MTDNLLAKQRAVFDEDNLKAYAIRVRKYFKNAMYAIDIGCGIGYQTRAIAVYYI
jgi:hypothetical protein